MAYTHGAGHFRRTAAQICHTTIFPFLGMDAFPFPGRKVPCQRIEEIVVLGLKDVFLAGHQSPGVLLFGMGAPFSSGLFHQAAVLPMLFTKVFQFAAFFLWDQDKQILVLCIQVI